MHWNRKGSRTIYAYSFYIFLIICATFKEHLNKIRATAFLENLKINISLDLHQSKLTLRPITCKVRIQVYQNS